jgi:signal transduction histidine kinase
MDRKKVELLRLSLFGRMVMGVSHEVDNCLSVVLGFAELIQISGGAQKRTMDGVAKILNAGERIGTIIRHFSAYVRPHDPAFESFPPGEAVAEFLSFARYDLGRNNVTLNVPERFPPGVIVADRRDFALVLLALLFNGSEAMAATGGILRLDVSVTGRSWEFVVADEGPGIPQGIAGKIFDEGFTTKSAPAHSGMGLSVSRQLAVDMGGTLSVENLPGRGCAAVLRITGR